MRFFAGVQPVVPCFRFLRFGIAHGHFAPGIFLTFQRAQSKGHRLTGGRSIEPVDGAMIRHIHRVAVHAIGKHQQVSAHRHHLLGQHIRCQRQIGDWRGLPVIVQGIAVDPGQLFHRHQPQRLLQLGHDAALFPTAQQRPAFAGHIAHGVKGAVVGAGAAVKAGELLRPQGPGGDRFQFRIVHARPSLRISANLLPV